MAAGLLDLSALRTALEKLEAADLPPRERAKAALSALQSAAEAQGMDLKLRKKPKA